MTRKVAVLGTGGIGKHHANWWNLEGARVVGILGRTPDSVAASAARLHQLFGYDGPTYTDLNRLLTETHPDIVDIATPPACHFAQSEAALRAGAQVLCEKPFVFDRRKDEATLLGQAESLVELAYDSGLLLGLCSQFSIAARCCLKLLRSRREQRLKRIVMELRSPERGRKPDPLQTWIDLGPHLIAALQVLLNSTEPEWQSLVVTSRKHDATFSFSAIRTFPVTVELTVGFTTGEPANVRRITLNDTVFDLNGEAGPDGHFRMRYTSSVGDDVACIDPMRLLIREFLAGKPPLAATDALLNQRWLLHTFIALKSAIGTSGS